MERNQKLSNAEILEYLKDYEPLQFDDHGIEEFRQVVVDDIYSPYVISSYGRIFSFNYRSVSDRVAELKPTIGAKTGYKHVNICIDGIHRDFSIHRLVALAFIPNPENKYTVNHIDGDKQNNCIWNLEWATSSENTNHTLNTGLMHTRCGEDIGDNIYITSQIEHVCELLQTTHKSYQEIADITGVSYNMVRHIKHGKSWKHISKKYDFTAYDEYLFQNNIVYINKVREVCRLLEANELNISQIAMKTGFSFNMVYNIYMGRNGTNISKDYNISNYKPRSNASNSINQ